MLSACPQGVGSLGLKSVRYSATLNLTLHADPDTLNLLRVSGTRIRVTCFTLRVHVPKYGYLGLIKYFLYKDFGI